MRGLTAACVPQCAANGTGTSAVRRHYQFFNCGHSCVGSYEMFLPRVSVRGCMRCVGRRRRLHTALGSYSSLTRMRQGVVLSPHLGPAETGILPVSMMDARLGNVDRLRTFRAHSLVRGGGIFIGSFLRRRGGSFRCIRCECRATSHRRHDVVLAMRRTVRFLRRFEFSNVDRRVEGVSAVECLQCLSSRGVVGGVEFVRVT